MEERLRQMIHDFGRALSVAISESPEASDSLKEIHDLGYSLYLLLGSGDSDLSEGRLTLTLPGAAPDQVALAGGSALPAAAASEATSGPAVPDAVFRINGKDLMFLRSVGIDPTRSLKPRRD